MPKLKAVCYKISHKIPDLPACLLWRRASSFVELCCWWWWWWWWWWEPECLRSCRCCISDSEGLRLPSRLPSSLSTIWWPRCTCSAGRSRTPRSSCRCFISASFNSELWLLTAACSERLSFISRSFTAAEDAVCNLQQRWNQQFNHNIRDNKSPPAVFELVCPCLGVITLTEKQTRGSHRRYWKQYNPHCTSDKYAFLISRHNKKASFINYTGARF